MKEASVEHSVGSRQGMELIGFSGLLTKDKVATV